MPSVRGRSRIKVSSSRLDELLKEFHRKFGYEMVKRNDHLDYVKFQRTVEQNNTHELLLEDHRWERMEKDFDPQRDIGDWLIFSYLIDDERDWFGRFVETQYPLTYSEYKMIEEIIYELEKRYEQEDSEGDPGTADEDAMRGERCFKSGTVDCGDGC